MRPGSPVGAKPGISGTSSVPGTHPVGWAMAATGIRSAKAKRDRRIMMGPILHSSLALGTIESRAIRLHDALDPDRAAAARAPLALLAIDGPLMLEIAELA